MFLSYVDILVNQLQAAALPRYAAAEKMVNPPIIAVRFGNDIFCKGVVHGSVATTYSGPILRTDKYAEVTVDSEHGTVTVDGVVMEENYISGMSKVPQNEIEYPYTVSGGVLW